MSQTIHCPTCKTDTRADSIADLIEAHTDDMSRFACAECDGTDAFLVRREAGRERWIKGIVPIQTKGAHPTHSPFVFLTADAIDGDVTGVEFKYYLTTRPSGRSRATRPDGGPVLTPAQLVSLVTQLAKIGVISSQSRRKLVRDMGTSAGNGGAGS